MPKLCLALGYNCLAAFPLLRNLHWRLQSQSCRIARTDTAVSPSSALCPLLLAAPANTLQDLPFAAQMRKDVGLGWGTPSSQALSKKDLVGPCSRSLLQSPTFWQAMLYKQPVQNEHICSSGCWASHGLFGLWEFLGLQGFAQGDWFRWSLIHRFHCLKRSFLKRDFL